MKTSFPNRISRLNEIFGYKRVAKYLSPADEIDVLKWANSDTLVNVKIDYSCLLYKFPVHRGTDPVCSFLNIFWPIKIIFVSLPCQ